MMETKQFVALGVIVAILIGVTAVFFAAGDPDGLESTALVVLGEKSLTGPTPEDADPEAVGQDVGFEYEAPMPDYTMGEGAGKMGEVIAVVVGIFLALLLVLGAGKAVTASKH
ncbi:MAG: PDGLE domain-containing protein [Methanofollis sp.]|uniref:PDGLE domain-containing protein n=1 Tax=Methanofollis sp. TaxID=2052835 RepID=UPI002635DBF9|nr:PDGLE domain-containing protein [Methanofollis sp.]MDD4253793.1 PDGLE domain-containing protein [Methanofollis sp.]